MSDKTLKIRLTGHFYRSIREIDTLFLKAELVPEQDWSNINKVFIVSTGRTGTMFFAKFFNLFPAVQSLHEPCPDFLDLALDYAQGRVSFESAAREIEKHRRVRCREHKRRNLDLYIESNNRYFSLLKPLRHVFPDAKIIYIVRDGRDYVRSGISRIWYKTTDTSPRLRADMFPSDPYYAQWDQMDRFAKIAWRWQKKDGFIHRDFQDLDNTLKVKFEDIFHDPERKGLYEITRFIGITDEQTRHYLNKMGNRKVNTKSQKAIPRWSDWDDHMKRVFDEIAADHMRLHYDYKGMT
ncbi:MAG: sulfotransferase [candidate division KSB1 bacterium]|nr:sulfotransferase [candidate division KSB1 bacterium]